MSLDQNCTTMNQMILAQREEAALLIKIEHDKILAKYQNIKTQVENARKNVKDLKEEAEIMNHKSMLLSGEMTNLVSTIDENSSKLISIECKIGDVRAEKIRTEMVKDKEIKTLEIQYEKLRAKKEENENFWIQESERENLDSLVKNIEKLRERKEHLENQIIQMSENISKSNPAKLKEECMILKKRNAAVLKRLLKRLEELETQLEKANVSNK